MKNKLLKPPEHDGEILFLPELNKFVASLHQQTKIGTAHQLGFFNPGIACKYLFVNQLAKGRKRLIFLDTEPAMIAARVPERKRLKKISLVDFPQLLHSYLTPRREIFDRFFDEAYRTLKKLDVRQRKALEIPFSLYRGLVYRNVGKKYLKEVLASAFLQFYALPASPLFLSDIIRSDNYKTFAGNIYKRAGEFRDLFNQALAEYGQQFHFRYKNFPFPRLQEKELPFWLVKDDRRYHCFVDSHSGQFLFPRAVTLTLYLRLYELGAFIHGVGGGNYEWIQDQLSERFFHRRAAPYAVLSGTFFTAGLRERDLPFFFYRPERVSNAISCLLGKKV